MPSRFGGSSRLLRHPAQYVVVAFSVACFSGSALLLLPFATQSGASTPPLTALFTATSAVCVTGLAVVDTGTYWSGFGQGVILLLVQVGGLGIMTLSSLIIVVLSRRMGMRQRMVAASERGSLDLGDLRSLLLGVIRLTLTVEVLATAALFLRFWLRHGEEPGRALYLGLFHAVSAFNNAGFGLFADNLVGLQTDPIALLVIAAAIVIGGLGFPVWIQIARQPRQPRRWDLHAKLTVATTIVLILTGWLLITWFEWTNQRTVGELSVGDSIVNGLFHAITPRTAGFNTVDVAALREPTRLLTEVLMFIGGGSGSTAGGIKVTTFALLGFVMWAEVRGDPDVVMFERRVPVGAQRQALTVALMAVGGVIMATMILVSVSDIARSDLLFEAVSALGTVGLSANITPLLPDPAQLVVIVLMFIGRVGPPTLFAALVLRERERLYRHPEERPIIG